MPPSANDAAAVSPSVILSNVKDCPEPSTLIVALSTVVPESNSIPVILVNAEKSKLWWTVSCIAKLQY